MDIVEILKMRDLYLKAMDEQRKREWLNKKNSRPRKKAKSRLS